MHDAGKLIVFDRLTTLRIDARRDLTITPAELGRVLRDLHEPLGGLAAHSWGLGASAAEAIATHHRNPMPRVRNALSEVLFVAEAADMAAVHGAELDLAALRCAVEEVGIGHENLLGVVRITLTRPKPCRWDQAWTNSATMPG